MVKAKVVRISAEGNYSAQAENEISIAFEIADGSTLELGEAIEVDLPNVVSAKTVVRLRDRKVVKIKLRENDRHDLRLPAQHGGSRIPTASRLSEK